MALLTDLYYHSPRDLQVDLTKASPVLLLPASRIQTNAFTRNKDEDVASVYNDPGLKKVVMGMDCDFHEIPLEAPDQLSALILQELNVGLFMN